MYGFHKGKKDSSKCIFSHPHFAKDKEYLVTYIDRAYISSRESLRVMKMGMSLRFRLWCCLRAADRRLWWKSHPQLRFLPGLSLSCLRSLQPSKLSTLRSKTPSTWSPLAISSTLGPTSASSNCPTLRSTPKSPSTLTERTVWASRMRLRGTTLECSTTGSWGSLLLIRWISWTRSGWFDIRYLSCF